MTARGRRIFGKRDVLVLHIRLFGGFEARSGGGPAIELPTKKTQALLAYLAIRPGEARTREKIADLLWSDRGDAQAKASLRQALTAFRKALKGLDPDPLSIEGEKLALDPAAVEVDVDEFERLVEEGSTGSLEKATSLYRGDLLDGLDARDPVFDDWLTVERERLRELAINALSRLLDQQTSSAQPDRAIDTAKRLLALDPLSEASHRALMGLYAARGERSHAIRQYETCRDLLKEQLGIEPEAETRALHDAIREGQTPKASEEAPVGGPRVVPVGDDPLPLPDKPSIAVLPFTNMSGDPEQEYFSDGIAEDIITELSRFRSLFVIARNSSFHYKGQSPKVQDIGRELGVQYIVEGSVRKAGNRVRITAQLVEAESGNHLWAERYDRDLDDIFAVQDEVTHAIVTAIEPTLGSAERDRAHRKPTGSLDAWESYQRGLWNLYRYAAQENTEAQSFFRRAIELDPNFAPAHAGLAHAIYLSFFLGFRTDRAPARGEARAAAQRALTLDGDDAVAHAIAGRVHTMLGERDAAISACETALALNPNLAMAHLVLGNSLVIIGRYKESIVEFDEAIRLSPRDPMLWNFLHSKAWAYLPMERYEEGLESTRAAQRQPNAGVWAYVNEVVALARLDRIDEAAQALERVHAIKPDFDMNFVVGFLQQVRAVGFELYSDALKKAGLEE